MLTALALIAEARPDKCSDHPRTQRFKYLDCPLGCEEEKVLMWWHCVPAVPATRPPTYESVHDADFDGFILPDFELVASEFAYEPLITIDVAFMACQDEVFGLIDPTFSADELVEALRAISNIWIKGGIWIRFVESEARKWRSISPAQSDAYRWLVSGSKQTGWNRYQRDIDEMLTNGPGNLGAELTKRLIVCPTIRASGHSQRRRVTENADQQIVV